jgi:hypothetical protein
MSDEAYNAFVQKYPSMKREDVEEIVSTDMLKAAAIGIQHSEIEFLRRKALDAMGTDHEMKFSDIESGMLRASLTDGRQALKEIMEKMPVETPACSDGKKMKNQGRKKNNNDDTGGN